MPSSGMASTAKPAADRLQEPPLALVGQHQAGLVVQLLVPAARLVDADILVPIVLRGLAERSGPDDADQQLEMIEPPLVGILDEADAAIEPAGIGPVVGIGIFARRVLRREDALSQYHLVAPRQFDAPSHRTGRMSSASNGPIHRAVDGNIGAEIHELQALRVVFVAVEPDRIIFFDGEEPAAVVGPRRAGADRRRTAAAIARRRAGDRRENAAVMKIPVCPWRVDARRRNVSPTSPHSGSRASARPDNARRGRP